MRGLIKSELWKSIHNGYFNGAIIVGLCIVAINLLESAIRTNQLTELLLDYIRKGEPISTSYEGFSLFISWIAVHPTGLGSNIFFFIWPILAAMPYGWSYMQDRHTGLYNQIVTKTKISYYYLSKYIATFLSGGIAIAFPLCLDLMLTALICPFCIPNVTMSLMPIINVTFLSKLYYSNPWMYAAIWCMLDFLWGGVTSCLCFCVGTQVKSSIAISISPFVAFLLLDFILSLMSSVLETKQIFSIMQLPRAASTVYNPYWGVTTILGVLFLLSLSGGYWQVRNHELV